MKTRVYPRREVAYPDCDAVFRRAKVEYPKQMPPVGG